jgi:hypothetical protein
MTGISFGIDSEQTGKIRCFDETSVEHLLPIVIEFVGKNSSAHSDSLISLFSDNSI